MATAFVTGGSGFVGRNLIRALRRRGDEVRALARSGVSIAAVEALGAKAVRGDLADLAALEDGMRGTRLVFHAAAETKLDAPRERFEEVTIRGTENALAAARAAGVARFVHIGTEAVLTEGAPIVRADETRPRAKRPASLYAWSKGVAEERVLAANGDGLETVVVRPRFIWGADDTSLLPGIAEVVTAGRFMWIDRGRYLSSTCHVANAVEGALLAADRGRPGEIYFLTDGEPIELRGFLTDLLATRGVSPGDRSMPRWVVRLLAALTSFLPKPPITKGELALFGVEITVDDAKARNELGYTSAMTREQGLAEMRGAA